MTEGSELRVAKVLGDWATRLERAEAYLLGYLDLACKRLLETAEDFHYRLVEARVKKPREVTRSLGEQGLSADDVLKVDDLIGGRVVVLSRSDIEILVDSIQHDEQCPLEDLERRDIDDESGYRATHIKGRIRSGDERFGCEIQIRTAIADAWAEISRAHLYRRDLAEILPKIAKTQSQALAAAEEALEVIRAEARRAVPAQPTATARQQEMKEGVPQAATGEGMRMGAMAPPPSIVRPPPKDEVLLQTHRISKARADAFLERFLEDRRKTAATEILFKRAEALRRVDGWNDAFAAGFNVLLHKGPFVEGSHWAPYRTWQFAVAMERHLLGRLERLLKESAQPWPHDVGLNWPAILRKVDELITELGNRGYTPTAIVVSAQLEPDLIIDFIKHEHVVAHWELPSDLQAPWIEGTYKGIMILNIRETPAAHSLFAADVGAFAMLTKYSPEAQCSIDEIDEGRAKEFLERNPAAVVVPEGRPDTLDERLRLLQLRVWLRLFESYGIELRDPSAALQVELMRR